MQHQKAPDGIITGIVGSAGSGKTGWLKQQIASSPRLLVWDIEGQYTERTKIIRTRAALVKAIQQDGRYSYQPNSLDDFDYWARAAFLFCQIGAESFGDALDGTKAAVLHKNAQKITGQAVEFRLVGDGHDGFGLLVAA